MLSIVTVALSVTIQPQFAIECLLRSNQQGWVTGQNFLMFGQAAILDNFEWPYRLGEQSHTFCKVGGGRGRVRDMVISISFSTDAL